MRERDIIIRKINLVLDDASDDQIKVINITLKKLIENNNFKELYVPHSNNYTQNGKQSLVDDIEEGNTSYESVN